MAPTDHLVVLRTRVDAHFAAAVGRSPEAFTCAAGCDRCCDQRFSVFEVEAAPIRRALAELETSIRERVRQQARDETSTRCALLVDGRCSVYEQRPLICRSHGLPIAVADPEGGLRVDHCPLNFVDGSPPRSSVLVLEAINRPLAVLAEIHAPGAPRVALAQLAAQPQDELKKSERIPPTRAMDPGRRTR